MDALTHASHRGGLRLSATDLQHILDDIRDETGVPGLAAFLYADGAAISASSGAALLGSGHLLWESSRYELSCLMKFYVSLLTLGLAAEECLSLDASVCEYIPELASAPCMEGVSLRHLLSHTSGYRGLDITDARTRWGCKWPQFVATLTRSPRLFTPGAVFNYEHTEHVLLGRVLERVTGEPATVLVRKRFFEPLGIKTSTAADDLNDPGSYVGQHRYDPEKRCFAQLQTAPFAAFWDCSLPSSTLKLADHARATAAILRSSSIKRQHVTAPAVKLPTGIPSGRYHELSPLSYSLACGDYGGGISGHNGSMPGQTCAIRFNLDARLILAVGVNAWVPYARDRVIDQVMRLCCNSRSRLTWRDRPMHPFELSELTADFEPEQLPGRYVGGYHEQVDVSFRERELRLQMGTAARPGPLIRIRLLPSSQWSPIPSDNPVSIGFFHDPDSGDPALMLGVHSYKRVS